MTSKRSPIERKSRLINAAAIEAWKAGDVRALHDALNLAPFEYCPLPRRFGPYGLPDRQPEHGTIMAQGWSKIKRLQDELRALAGEPGVKS